VPPPATDGRSAPAPRVSRLSAALYEPVLWLGERAGMAARRQRLVRRARGAVLEIGAGTGLNLPHYGEPERLVLTEPEPEMATRLRRRLAVLGREAEVRETGAEALPFSDGEFDTAVSTLVLCTVPDPSAALRELRRVLRPGGSLLFIEHVRAQSPRLAAWQDRLRGAWALLADGCQCNRRTLELIEANGFEVRELERERWRAMPPLVRPLVTGVAARA